MEKSEYLLGAYLKEERKKRGLSLQEIYNTTRISIDVLRSIEEGENLPPQAYLKGFVKTYAKTLDLDETEILKQFFKEKPDNQQSLKEDLTEKPSKTFWRKEIVLSGLGLVLICFFVFQNFKKNDPPQDEINYHLLGEEKSKEPEQKTQATNQVLQKREKDSGQEEVYAKTLMIQSMEDAIMYFKVDGQETITKPLQKNTWYIIKARDKIYVRVDGRSYLNLVYEGFLSHISSDNAFERIF